MKTFYIIYLLLACQSIITGLSAQTVSGKLVDEKNEPMPYANVVLLSLPDSAFVSGTISGDDGTFSLSATAQPQIVRISSIGYTTIYRPVNPADMGIVRLTADTHQLGEVTVKADLPKMRLKGDAMVTTVAGSVLEKSGTGNDLLDKIPGISAEEGAVNVFGRESHHLVDESGKHRILRPHDGITDSGAHHRAVETAVHGRALQAVVLHQNPQRHKVTEQPCRYICLAQQLLAACRYTA